MKEKTDLRKQAEEILKQKIADQTLQEIATNAQINELILDLQTHQVELEMQNEELREAHREVQNLRDRYYFLFDLAPTPYITFTAQGVIAEINLAAVELVGSARRDLRGRHFTNMLSPDSRLRFLTHLENVFRSRKRETVELSLLRSNQEIIYTEVESVALETGESGEVFCLSTVFNITKRKTHENDLVREKEELYKSLARNLVDTAVFLFDKSFKHILVEGHALASLGVARNELEGKTFALAYNGKHHPFEELYRKAFVGGIEQKDIAYKGRHYAVSAFPVRDVNGAILYGMLIAHDITEQKYAEHAHAEASAFLQNLIQTIPAPIFYKDTNLVYTGCNKAFETFLGRTHDEVVGATVDDIAEEKDAELFRSSDLKALESKGTQVYEARVRNGKGELRDIIFHKGVFCDEEGETKGVVGFMLDITERKRAEERRKESEERFERAIEATNDGLWDYNTEAGDLFLSKRCQAMLGIVKDEIAHTPLHMWNAFFAPATREVITKTNDPTSGFETESYRAEVRFAPKSEGERWFFIRGKRVLREGVLIRMTGTITDIDYRKKLEEELKNKFAAKTKSIEKAQELQRNINSASYAATANYAIYSYYMPSEELGGDFFTIITERDDRVVLLLADCMGHGIEASMEATLLKAICDRYLWLLISSAATDTFLERVSDDYKNYAVSGHYPTLFVAVIDRHSNAISYSNANGELPYLVRDGAATRFPRVRGYHIGFEDEPYFEQQTFTIVPDDYICLFSDSLIEARDRRNNAFGGKTLEGILGRFGKGMTNDVEMLLDTLEREVGPFPLVDDLTLIVVHHIMARHETYAIHTRNDLEELRIKIEHDLMQLNYSGLDVSTISLALHELGLNAIHHGNRNDPEKAVTVTLHYDAAHVKITIEDEGEGFEPGTVPSPEDFSRLLDLMNQNAVGKYTHGRGIWLSREYMDSVSYNSKGNAVTLVKKCGDIATVFNYLGRTEKG